MSKPNIVKIPEKILEYLSMSLLYSTIIYSIKWLQPAPLKKKKKKKIFEEIQKYFSRIFTYGGLNHIFISLIRMTRK